MAPFPLSMILPTSVDIWDPIKVGVAGQASGRKNARFAEKGEPGVRHRGERFGIEMGELGLGHGGERFGYR